MNVLLRFITFFMLTIVQHHTAIAGQPSQSANSIDDLEWGTVLFNYYSENHFDALVDYQYNLEFINSNAIKSSGQLLNGGMSLAYGLADESKRIFDKLLKKHPDGEIRTQAWYHLADLYYHKDDTANAYHALSQINGHVPQHLAAEYYYLHTLISDTSQYDSSLFKKKNIPPIGSIRRSHPLYHYIMFNLAIRAYEHNKMDKAINQLDKVIKDYDSDSEYSILADRARHGLAKIAIKQNQMSIAWRYLKQVRTSGLYSNRALLTYAWAAIDTKKPEEAIPALEILNKRSIALQEVQEAKVLLAHLYEQEKELKKSLKYHLLSIDAFQEGINLLNEVRGIIKQQDGKRSK